MAYLGETRYCMHLPLHSIICPSFLLLEHLSCLAVVAASLPALHNLHALPQILHLYVAAVSFTHHSFAIAAAVICTG